MTNIFKRFDEWLSRQPANRDDFVTMSPAEARQQSNIPVEPAPKSPVEVATGWDFNAEADKAAKLAEIKVLQDAPEKIAKYRADHRKDVAAFKFECKRHGDFLALFVTRIQMVDWQGTTALVPTAHMINLGKANGVTFEPGRAPDMKGAVKYRVSWEPDSIPGGDTSRVYYGFDNSPMRAPVKGHHLVAYPSYDGVSYGQGTFGTALVDTTPPKNTGGGYGGSRGDSTSALHTTANYPRPPQNDVIDFGAAYTALHVPAGLGATVYAAIQKELAAPPVRPIKLTVSATPKKRTRK